jgi:hypothetical protein
MLKSFVLVVPLLFGACSDHEGQRCNPLAYSNSGVRGNCAGQLDCVYPTAPSCGVAYCCAVDESGNIVDDSPSCQPDPSLASVCMLDLAGVTDGGTPDGS